jgi:hypothetical protein
MCVPEAMPRNKGELQSNARRSQYAAKQILGVECCLVSTDKDQIIWASLPATSLLGEQGLTDRLAHRNLAPTAFRFRCTELSF